MNLHGGNKVRFLLVAPPKKGLRHSEEHPPVGFGYMATTLRRMGHEPDIQDSIINRWKIKDLLDYIQISKPDIVGITVFSQAMSNVKEILGQIKMKNPKIITIVGGPHPTAIPERTLQYFTDADYGIIGEGEIPLQYLMNILDKNKEKQEDVPGLIWRENNGVRWNAKVEYDKIDDFGFPAWDLIDPRRYFSSPGIGDKTGVIHTSRGCPFSCEFCVRLGKKLRYHSLNHTYKEIQFLHRQYGIDRFRISDEGFPINTKFTKAFCSYVIGKGDGFSYIAGTGLRLNVLDDELLELMKKANFEPLVGVGIESGVPRVRKLMKKNLTQEHLYRGVDLLNKYGFRPSGNFILGFPGETKEEMRETIRIALRLKLWGAAFSPFSPLPGSGATNKLIEKGELPKDFDFSKIDLDAILYVPKGMTKEELDAIRKKAVFKFNMRPKMLWHHFSRGRLLWSVVKTMRIFFPSRLVPKPWRRIA